MTTSISLALQGGGAHGAFTWGALERLLDEPGLVIEGISGTSAGAMNACALAKGLGKGGPEAAKAELEGFWRRISELGVALNNPYQTNPYQSLMQAWNLDWLPASVWLDLMTQVVSPYQLNPLDHNPLRGLLDERFGDYADLRGETAVRVFICATNLRTNRMKVFTNEELSTDALLASACIPQLHRAVEVAGDYYWDGGFIGNPVLKPLIRVCSARDIVIVKVNPLLRAQLPISARDIVDRLNEVTMNAALIRELGVIATINRLVKEGTLTDPSYVDIRLHAIADEAVMAALGVRSKNNTAWAFLTYLRDAGRAAAGRWLEENGSRIGKDSTLDLKEFAA
jgi:NTE family protein